MLYHLDDVSCILDIPLTVQQYALCWLSIPTRSTGLLVVSLYGVGNVIVNDYSHIRLINAHAEGSRCYDHIHLTIRESALCLVPGHSIMLDGQIRVVWQSA